MPDDKSELEGFGRLGILPVVATGGCRYDHGRILRLTESTNNRWDFRTEQLSTSMTPSAAIGTSRAREDSG